MLILLLSSRFLNWYSLVFLLQILRIYYEFVGDLIVKKNTTTRFGLDSLDLARFEIHLHFTFHLYTLVGSVGKLEIQ